MALQNSVSEQAALNKQRIPNITWDQFQYWYQGFEHSFKNGIGGPTTDQINEIRSQLARVRGSDYYSQTASANIAAGQSFRDPYFYEPKSNANYGVL